MLHQHPTFFWASLSCAIAAVLCGGWRFSKHTYIYRCIYAGLFCWNVRFFGDNTLHFDAYKRSRVSFAATFCIYKNYGQSFEKQFQNNFALYGIFSRRFVLSLETAQVSASIERSFARFATAVSVLIVISLCPFSLWPFSLHCWSSWFHCWVIVIWLLVPLLIDCWSTDQVSSDDETLFPKTLDTSVIVDRQNDVVCSDASRQWNEINSRSTVINSRSTVINSRSTVILRSSLYVTWWSPLAYVFHRYATGVCIP